MSGPRHLARLAATIGLLLAVTPAAAMAASPPLPFCAPADRECARIDVPLDRSGRVAGQVGIQVERERAKHATRAPLVVVGPAGQSATRLFDPETLGSMLGGARDRDLIVFDERGTGDSGALRCTALQRAASQPQLVSLAAPAAACARQLGPQRDFYSVRDSVEDLDAIRVAIGAPQIAILAMGAGSDLAVRYAQRHPEHVERLVLDSPSSGPDGFDPLLRGEFLAAPRVMGAFCAIRACRAVTPDPAGDLRRLAARLRGHVLRGRYFDGSGRPHAATLRPIDLLQLVADESGREGMPAAVRAAVRGDAAPILRAQNLLLAAAAADTPGAKDLSLGMVAARTCEDGDLPWARTAPPAEREAQARAHVGQLGADAFGAFGPEAALQSPDLDLCRQWPAGAPAPPAAMGRLPAVPALLISGNEDLHAPREDVRRLAALIPGSRVLPISGSGHDVLLGDGPNQTCASDAVRAFLRGVTVASCPRPRDVVNPVIVGFPEKLREVRPANGVRGRAGRTLAALRRTLADISFTTFDQVLDSILSEATVRVGGLRGGHVAIHADPDRLRLHDVVFVPGVRISGRLSGFVLDRHLRGRLTIAGAGAASGTLVVRGRHVTGRLGGKGIDVRMRLDDDSLAIADETF
jgi:pimeloyl-ACP methyl ester carboxylesterase